MVELVVVSLIAGVFKIQHDRDVEQENTRPTFKALQDAGLVKSRPR